MADSIEQLREKYEAALVQLKKEKAAVEEKNKQLIQQRLQFLQQQSKESAANRSTEAQTGDSGVQSDRSQLLITGRVGNLQEYSLKDDWNHWIERFEQYYIANDIASEKGVALFLTLIGSEGYALLRSLCTPCLPANKSLKELNEIMKNHLQPKPSVIAERYKFKECSQKDTDSIMEFLANLKRLSTYCEFGSSLESHLRDQFVWGVKNERIKKRLLSEHDLTYARAVELAQTMEMATKDVAEMGASSKGQVDSINFVGKGSKKSSTRESSVKCWCCGRSNHPTTACRYRSLKCRNCQKPGHLVRMCKVKKENNEKGKSDKINKNGENRQNFIWNTSEKEENFDTLFHLNEGNVKPAMKNETIQFIAPWRIGIKVQNKEIEFHVDSGSEISVISEEEFVNRREWSTVPLDKTQRRFKTHPGHKIEPLGVLNVEVEYQNKKLKLPLFVLPGDGPPLVGRAWICALGIPVERFTNSNENSRIGMILSQSKKKY
ncbi:uncharacterized protein [Venturia canescens]|uniref:uncharacterized protein n=1 Tax=Venturia canescens TaxID=32260 RepID=UPI001C9C6897|nr:uncharacterized protein LOC122418364 [Venturia canescens]